MKVELASFPAQGTHKSENLIFYWLSNEMGAFQKNSPNPEE